MSTSNKPLFWTFLCRFQTVVSMYPQCILMIFPGSCHFLCSQLLLFSANHHCSIIFHWYLKSFPKVVHVFAIFDLPEYEVKCSLILEFLTYYINNRYRTVQKWYYNKILIFIIGTCDQWDDQLKILNWLFFIFLE